MARRSPVLHDDESAQGTKEDFDLPGAELRVTVLTRGLAIALSLFVFSIVYIIGASSSKPGARGVLGEKTARVRAVGLSPDGRELSACGFDGSVMVWDTESGTVRSVAPAGDWLVLKAAVSADGSILALENDDRTVSLWHVSGEPRRIDLPSHSRAVQGIGFSPDGATVATADEACVRLWDTATGHELPHPGLELPDVLCIAFAPDAKTVAFGRKNGSVRIWDRAGGRTAVEFQAHGGPVQTLSMGDHGRMLVTTSATDTIARLWDCADGRKRGELSGHARPVQIAVFSPSGRLVATSGLDCTLKIWDALTGTLRQTLSELDGTLLSVAFSADGRVLAGGGYGPARLWDVDGI
jgi:WD40 repeat protein